MREASEDDAAQAAQAFKPNRRPLAIMLIANVLLAVIFLGIPYVRGRSHAQASLEAFSRFAGCLLGGEPRGEPGLLLPAGERTHFAAQVLHGAKDWPARCRPALRAVATEDALFVWPSVKQAGSDVRAVVTLIDRELVQLARNRAAGRAQRVPTRPLLALAKLQGVLSVLARTVNADAVLTAEALRFPKPASVIEPARLPLVAGGNSALTVWAGQDGLSALALDTRGVSVLQVEGGQLERARLRRTSLVRAGLRVEDEPLLVWAMAQERCDKDEQHCLRRASGVAYVEPEAVTLPIPIWLAGHPAGRADRSLRFGLSGKLDLLARATVEGALEVRRFTLPAREGKDEKSPPIAADQRVALPAPTSPADALLLDGQPPAVAYATADDTGMAAHLFTYGDTGEGSGFALGSARGAGAWIDGCAAADAQERFIAFGTREELALVRAAADGTAIPLFAPSAVALGPVLPRDEARRDRVRVLCGGGGATLLALQEDRGLFALRCTRDACVRGPLLARDVMTFDAALSGDALVVAYTRRAEPQIAVLRADAQGAPLGTPETPAPCWDPDGGLCGQPTLTAAGDRLLLCARDGGDLLALESSDGGRRWQALPGLSRGAAISTDPNAPLQQHRKRKGLD